MMSRLFEAGRRLLSDSDARDGEVEMRIVLAQVAFIGAPICLIWVGIMVALP